MQHQEKKRFARGLFILAFFFLCAAWLYARDKQTDTEEIILKAGDAGLPFLAKDLAGKIHMPGKYLGKEVLVFSFFYPGCKPCLEEMPRLDSYLKRKHKDFRLYFIGSDFKNDKAKVQKFVQKMKINSTVLFDSKSLITNMYQVKAFPSCVIIDSKGKISYISRGYNEKIWKDLKKQLKKVK